MTIGDYIKLCFSSFGEISDTGIEKFALELGFDSSSDVNSNDKKQIFDSVKKFMVKFLCILLRSLKMDIPNHGELYFRELMQSICLNSTV